MPISLEKAAKLLGTSEEMLLRWARQGVVPAIELNGAYCFDTKVLTSWAKQRKMPLKPATSDPQGEEPDHVFSLHRAMEQGGVYFDVGGADIPSVFKAAIGKIAIPKSIKANELLSRLLEREELASTGIGNGVAVPHPRHPFKNAPSEGMICTCFLEREVDFCAIDGNNVFVLFLMLSPNTRLHLQLLGRLSFCLHAPSFVKTLNGCRDDVHFLNRVKEMEKQFSLNRSQDSPRIP